MKQQIWIALVFTWVLLSCTGETDSDREEEDSRIHHVAGIFQIHQASGSQWGYLTIQVDQSSDGPVARAILQTSDQAPDTFAGEYWDNQEEGNKVAVFRKGGYQYQIDLGAFEAMSTGFDVCSGTVIAYNEDTLGSMVGSIMTVAIQDTTELTKWNGDVIPLDHADSLLADWMAYSIGNAFIGYVRNTGASLLFTPLILGARQDSVIAGFAGDEQFRVIVSGQELQGELRNSDAEPYGQIRGTALPVLEAP